MANVIFFPFGRTPARQSVTPSISYSLIVDHCHRHKIFDEATIYMTWVKVKRRFYQHNVQRVAKILPLRSTTAAPGHQSLGGYHV